ncbi:hypothetical protein EV182_008378 [Spiromyces aspiralis]|uniref:Uncharacterized protein n=1 Tax=Spiromyces aspiralis TaxID=68401 RepID=A0ACC1H6Z9_9FUNG|nr:hypothetical protein EV182_008378 [Spiromyces aspiralis]
MLKYIAHIKVAFPPFKPSSTSARIFLNHVTSTSNMISNPECKIDVTTLSDLKATPTVEIRFKDNKMMMFRGHETSGDEMVSTVAKYCRKLGQEEDLRG